MDSLLEAEAVSEVWEGGCTFVPLEWVLPVLLLSGFAAGIRSLASAACDSSGVEAFFEFSFSELSAVSLPEAKE